MILEVLGDYVSATYMIEAVSRKKKTRLDERVGLVPQWGRGWLGHRRAGSLALPVYDLCSGEEPYRTEPLEEAHKSQPRLDPPSSIALAYQYHESFVKLPTSWVDTLKRQCIFKGSVSDSYPRGGKLGACLVQTPLAFPAPRVRGRDV